MSAKRRQDETITLRCNDKSVYKLAFSDERTTHIRLITERSKDEYSQVSSPGLSGHYSGRDFLLSSTPVYQWHAAK